jgi:hypothetical protein
MVKLVSLSTLHARCYAEDSTVGIDMKGYAPLGLHDIEIVL